MSESALLKLARSRDDRDFVLRVAAALTIQAQYNFEAKPVDQSVESVAMTEWVLNNPLVPIDIMTAYVATHPEVSDAIVINDGAIDTSAVQDSDITYVVSAKWPVVALKKFAV